MAGWHYVTADEIDKIKLWPRFTWNRGRWNEAPAHPVLKGIASSDMLALERESKWRALVPQGWGEPIQKW